MSQHSSARVSIAKQAAHALGEDVRQRHAIEACGLLLGRVDTVGNWHITRVRPLRNVYNSPANFEFLPEDLLKAELEHPGEIIGVYHSHPTGLRRASSTDRANMQRVNIEQQIPWVWLIISGPFNHGQAQEQKQLAVVAYHHYAERGLLRLPIDLEQ